MKRKNQIIAMLLAAVMLTTEGVSGINVWAEPVVVSEESTEVTTEAVIETITEEVSVESETSSETVVEQTYELTYTELEDGTLEITGFTGEASGDLVIPEMIDGKRVTKIGKWAFFNCSGFEGSLLLPESIRGIGVYAFSDCSGLIGTLTLPKEIEIIDATSFTRCSGISAIVISEENENYKTVDGILYTKDGTHLLTCPTGKIGELEILSTVTTIGSYAFHKCSGLTGGLNLPESLQSIEEEAFSGCSLTGVLNLPESLQSIGNSAFSGCAGLTGTLILPEGLQRIGEFAFSSCNFTGNIIIPSSVTNIERFAFFNCSSLSGTLTLLEGLQNIEKGAFYGCSGLTGTLILPDGLQSVGEEAFFNCSGLTGELTIPKGLQSIGTHAFSDCSGLTGTLTMAEGLQSIGSGAFYGCKNISDVIVPSSLISIQNFAFHRCTGIEKVYYAGSEEEWNEISIEDYNDNLINATIHFNATSLDEANELIDNIRNATAGDKITAELPTEDATLPAEALDAAKEKGVELEIVLEKGATWNIDAADISDSNTDSVDLSVTQTTIANGNIAEVTITNLAGDRTAEQLVFGQADDFPFTGELTLNALSTTSGNKAVLVQMVNGELKLSDSTMLSDGGMTFEVSKGADSAIVYGVNGDCDGNAKVNMKDLMQILHSVSNRTAINEVQKGFVDINMNNKVEMTDLMRELHYISGRNDEL